MNESMLSQFLVWVFPELSGDVHHECWVAKAIQSQHTGLNVLSDAIRVVEKHDQSNVLACKLRREHPTGKAHNTEFDGRVRDCLTEACALAWADLRNLGVPEFCSAEGAPDLVTSNGCWIEAKAIHASQKDEILTEQMLQGAVASGHVTKPHPGLYDKFQNAFQDSLKKFKRQDSHDNVVFFNLTILDVPQIPIKDEVFANLSQWAELMVDITPDTKIIVCYGYDWRNPCRDPFVD